MVKVKICGITNIDDAMAAVDFGADALGFVFHRQSPRFLSPEKAAEIISRVPLFVQTVGVFANESREHVEAVISTSRIDLVQLHGDEDPAMCKLTRRVIKGIRIKSLESLSPLAGYKRHVAAFLLDAFTPDTLGGTGTIFNWDIAIEAKQFGRIILAGGLTPENVSKAIGYVRVSTEDQAREGVSLSVQRAKIE